MLTALAEWDDVAELLDVELVFGGVVVVVVEVLFGGVVVVVVVVDFVCATSGDAATRVARVAMRSFIRILLLKRAGRRAGNTAICLFKA